MIGAVILAAGQAKRMGRAKQLLEWQGEPLVRYVTRQVLQSRFDFVRVVTGAYAREVQAALEGLKVELITNPEFEVGQSTSVRRGLTDLPHGVSGVAFVLADQPLIRIETYNHLIQVFAEEKPGFLLPTYQGKRGNPVFFHQRFFDQLLEIEGDRGGRDILRQNEHLSKEIAIDDPGIVIDLDNWEEYQHYSKERGFKL